MIPNIKNKYGKESAVQPAKLFEYRKQEGKEPNFKPPKGMIVCYSKKFIKYVIKRHKPRKARGFRGDVYVFNKNGVSIGIVANFGVGAPAAVLLVEECIAFGVKKFISVGTAGTLQRNINYGDLLLSDKAIRDEGTSYHYLKSSKYAYPSIKMLECVKKILKEANYPYHVGATWTTDAPYRETAYEIKKYQAENVMAVDMETSALYAVAEYRKVNAGSIFSISDSLAGKEWNIKHHLLERSFEKMFDIAVRAISAN